jgi:purine-binding chemotaxis protein CheW
VHAVARAARAESTLTPERAREVLRTRARELARKPPSQARDDQTTDAITFVLAGERYAVETRAVVEVFRLTSLTTLPGAEAPTLGLTAWRGRLLTIADLRAALGVPTGALNDMSYVIVLGMERAAFGVLADAMHDVITLEASAVLRPAHGLVARRAAIRGVTADGVMVIDSTRLIAELSETSQGERTA